MEKLALFGGNPIKTTAFNKGKRFGEEELLHLKEALDQQTLFYWNGKKVKAFCDKLAGIYDFKHCVAASSCTAAIHIALDAVGVTEGDEVIVPPITDMGTVIGVLYQNAIPIFADLDPHTYNYDVKSLEQKISSKTKAVIIVHLAGNPADMDAIMPIMKKHNVKMIEDCAQSWLSYYKGKLAGTFGDISCFSTNDFKHISTGDGGAVLMQDEAFYRRAHKFADKNYDRLGDGHALRNCEYLAPNYRMTELQGAVGIAQLDKLEGICKRRNAIGDRITKEISGLKGIYPPKVLDGCKSSYWFYMMQIDENEAGVHASEFAKALSAEGIPAAHGYIPTCVYEYPVFTEKNAHPGSHSPFDSKHYGKDIEYKKGLCPTAERILDRAVKFSISEFYSDNDVNDIIVAIRKVGANYK